MGLWIMGGQDQEGMDMAKLGRRRAIGKRVMGLMGNGLGLDQEGVCAYHIDIGEGF